MPAGWVSRIWFPIQLPREGLHPSHGRWPRLQHKKGVTVNNVAIGAVETDAMAGIMAQPERFAKMVRVYPIGRIGQPEEIPNMVLFQSSSSGEWITGQTYPVNGGYSTAM